MGIILIAVFCIVIVALCYRTAPEGWQDADGFHFGVQPRPRKETECK